MSEASERGRAYELKIQKLTAHKLKLDVKRDPRSGAGDWHKEDIRDRYGELPISVEIKNQETLKLKEWWRDAEAKASVGQAPIVVFPMETEDLCILRYSDLLNFVKEMFDWRLTAEDLSKPQPFAYGIRPVEAGNYARTDPRPENDPDFKYPVDKVSVPRTVEEVENSLARAAGFDTPTRRCRNGHAIPDGRDRCMAKGCPFSATYKKPKDKK